MLATTEPLVAWLVATLPPVLMSVLCERLVLAAVESPVEMIVLCEVSALVAVEVPVEARVPPLTPAESAEEMAAESPLTPCVAADVMLDWSSETVFEPSGPLANVSARSADEESAIAPPYGVMRSYIGTEMSQPSTYVSVTPAAERLVESGVNVVELFVATVRMPTMV